jgi:uncharacterized protein YndB with AHSA1/START domain
MTPASELTKIERSIRIRAPRERVYQALTTAAQFAGWFGVIIEGEFQPDTRVRMTSTHESCKGATFYITIEDMTPPRYFSWRWHPGIPEPDIDYSKEPTTKVEFRLEESAGETTVTVVESGFDRISLARRARIFEGNEKGWEHQLSSLQRYLGDAA